MQAQVSYTGDCVINPRSIIMIDKLDKETVLQLIEEGLFTGGVHLFDSIGSTNDWSLAELKHGREPPFVCITDHQSRGRGRRGRHWLSPPAANIYMSLAWHFELPADQLGVLSLAQGIAVINALRQAGIRQAWLKWPNDVMINANKIAGVLIETSAMRANSCNAVIGIGLNYQIPENSMPESAICMTDVAHSGSAGLPGRNNLLAILLKETVSMCHLYQQKATAILADFKHELEALNGKIVSVHAEKDDWLTGTVLGINDTGELRVLVAGHERTFNSADVSIKALSDQPVTGEAYADD